MKAAAESDDCRATGGGPGNLHGIFDSFGAGRDEDRLFGKISGRQLVQALGQLNVILVGTT